jgi:predicted nucleic acid-binding protein
VVGHRQVTDAYLLTAAVRSGMKLLTFDSGLESLLASPAERRAHVEVLTGPV